MVAVVFNKKNRFGPGRRHWKILGACRGCTALLCNARRLLTLCSTSSYKTTSHVPTQPSDWPPGVRF